jgi:uncharacterized protein YbjQ (UPF0145 family)/DNA-directed RNA polymerase subunit RPC12/RpoP
MFLPKGMPTTRERDSPNRDPVGNAMKCSRCWKDFGGAFGFLTADLAGENLCPECQSKELQRQDAQAKRETEIKKLAESVIVTTTPSIDGHRVTNYLGIESVEIVIGTGFFSELSGDVSDFFGQRSKGFEGKLQEAKRVAFNILKTRAAGKGANAVIGIDLDYTEFSGNRIGLILNGTLVRVAPLATSAE